MRRNLFALIVCFSMLLVFAGCSRNENGAKQAGDTSASQNASENQLATSTKPPPADVVKVSADGAELKAGGSGEAAVKLTIASGYHINANPASFSWLKPTVLEAESGEGVTPGKPVYPPSVTRKFSFSNDALAVYEGDATIKLPLSAAGGAKKGAHTLKGKVRVQACDDEACYPPTTIETSIPVTVK
jgi:hypothetical protein